MNFSAAYNKAYGETLGFEGNNLSNVKGDPGEETYCGISRVYWKSWIGWGYIDRFKENGKVPEDIQEMLVPMVKEFYKINFWDRMRGDEIANISERVAIELFDSSVNMDVSDAVRFMQTALNMQNHYGKAYPDITVDGKLGNKTIDTLKRYLASSPGTFEDNENILLNCMNGEQYIFYKNNPRHEAFRGWFRRV